MAYLPRARIEARAAELWRREALTVGFDAEALLDSLGLGLLWDPIAEEPGDRILGALRANERLVVLNERLLAELESNEGLRRFTLGHEIGHWILHAEDARAGTQPLFAGGRTWCRSGSAEPVERQAEMYAGALLVPEDRLRQRLRPDRQGGWAEVYELAEVFAVSPTAMIVRLEELGLSHRDGGGSPVPGGRRDPDQVTLFK